MAGIWNGYEYSAELYDSNTCKVTWRAVIEYLANNYDWSGKEWVLSDNVSQYAFCRSSGKLAGTNCYDTAYGWYDNNNLPGRCNGGSDHIAGPAVSPSPSPSVSPDASLSPSTSPDATTGPSVSPGPTESAEPTPGASAEPTPGSTDEPIETTPTPTPETPTEPTPEPPSSEPLGKPHRGATLLQQRGQRAVEVKPGAAPRLKPGRINMQKLPRKTVSFRQFLLYTGG